jgi:hypothetical protein
MFQIIFWTILLYLLYRFVFGFLIPVITASRQMRGKIRQMQEQMKNQYEQQDPQQGYSTTNSATTDSRRTDTSKGDYIDFEEVK